MNAVTRLSLTAAVVLAVTATAAVAATALPPLLVTGACPAGSARATKWCLFEDLNGDGIYDWVDFGDCDGVVRGHSWSVSGDPFERHPDDVLIGQLPAGIVDVAPDLSYTQQPGGLYSWTVTERIPTGVVVCVHSRNADMVLGSTCPPDNNLD
ncbi:MAG: hypothetical protein JST22_02435 [Bacteroidetes bacterium]|nr:hypothetical protein [Bacteroidota bacterium]